jgi:hypothetical protein
VGERDALMSLFVNFIIRNALGDAHNVQAEEIPVKVQREIWGSSLGWSGRGTSSVGERDALMSPFVNFIIRNALGDAHK